MKSLTLFFTLFLFTSFSTNNIDKLSHSDFLNKLIECDIKYPDIVFAQAILESGNFTSKLFKTHNNLFGMKVPSKRKTTALNKKGYAKYDSVDDSIQDYYLFQQYVMRNKEMTRDEYIRFIGRNYAEDKNYINKINKTIKIHKELFI